MSARPSTRGRLRSPGPRADGSGGGDGPEDLVVCIDLLGVAVGAGHSIPDAIRAVADAEGGTLARELDRVARALDRGSTTAAALDELPLRLGPSVAPLTGALLSTLGSGAPAAHMLHRLADAERRRLRHRTEARLRRLPVLLTVPLVVFVLPAFVVMTLVPVAVTVAGGLDRPSIAGS